MEPETMLAKKIKIIEQNPLPWKKAEVWFRIHEQISINRKSYRFYYYAAAVIFFMFFNIYQLQQVRIESDAVSNQPLVISSVQTQLTEDKNVDQAKIVFKQSTFISQKSQTHIAVVQHDEVLASDNELAEVDIQLAPEELIIKSTEVKAVSQRVEPIVGVVQLAVNDVASVKIKRKKLFHKLEPAEKEFEVGHQNTIIIARIK